MEKNKLKSVRRLRRKRGLRKNLLGTSARPRMSVFRSGKQIYVQVIDDVAGKTLTSASSLKLDKGSDVDAASQVGKQIAEKTIAAGINEICFDRNGFQYHGRIKALAESARKAGLKF